MSARDRLEETRIRMAIEYILFPGVVGLVWLLLAVAYLVGPLDAAGDQGRFRLLLGLSAGLTLVLLGLQQRNLRQLRKRERELLAERGPDDEGPDPEG